MNPAKKLLALILSISILVSVCPTFNVTFTAETDEDGAETTTTTETEEVCEECGGSDAHTDSCSFNTINNFNEDTESTCNVCGQTDSHAVGCLATFTEVNQTGYFVSDSVTLYKNPTQLPAETITLTGDQMPASFMVQYSFPGENGVTWYVLNTEDWNTEYSEYGYVNAADVTFTAPDSEELIQLKPCTICGLNDCSSTHATWCTICQKDDCGLHCTLDFLPAGLTAESADVQGTTATINSTSINLYKSLDNNANGIVVSDEAGTQIKLITKYTFTKTDGTTLVFYRYDYTGTNTALADAAFSEYSGYVFVYAGDISVDETSGGDSSDETLVQTDKKDESTGVSISAQLPADVTLSVISKTLADSGIDTNLYPVGDASLFYDVTLYQNGSEYQPTNGITITFPETAILANGFAVGDSYHVYHIHDGVVEMSAAAVYNGGELQLSFDSLSIIGITEVDFTVDHSSYGDVSVSEQYSPGLYATVNVGDQVYLYTNPDKGLGAEIKVSSPIRITVAEKYVFSNNADFSLYRIYYDLYSSDTDYDEDFANLVSTSGGGYSFIEVNDVTLTCCYNCTGVSGCTCGCDSCECNTTTTETTLEDENGSDITVTGVLPINGYVKATESSTVPSAIISTDHLDFSVTITQFGYDITLYNSSDVEVQPDGTVTVYVPNAWDTSLSNPIVDVYHILDDADAIVTAQANGTLLTTTDATMVASYAEEAAIARSALGLADSDADVVAYVLLSTRSDGVELTADGGIQFKTDSFSEYYIVSGDTEAGSITEDSTIYITQGLSGTFRIQDSDVTLTAGTVDSDVTVTKETSGSNRTTFNVSAASNASIGDTSVYTLSWSRSGQSKEITITVVVVDASEYVKQNYLENTVNHLQIDIAATAVALGYNDDESFSLNLGFTNDTKYLLNRVEDDSAVGFYYVLEYTYTDEDGNEVPVTITVRIDELASELPDGVTFADVGAEWFVNSVIAQEEQVTFGNKSDSSQAAFPVGTEDYPIVYSITVETVKELTKNGETTASNVEISVSNEIQYWDDSNECPGAMGSTIGSQSGMDLGDFTSGTVLNGTTYYVVFSNLTKVVSGYTFSTGESKNYVFTIYRRTEDTTDGDDWTAFDTISITATGATTSTNFTTDASKYNVGNISLYEYKIVETGYSISGYGCTNVIEVKSGESYVLSSDGVFTFTTTTSSYGKTVTYSAEIRCTNTYAEAGLTVSKVTKNAPTSAANDEFTVKVTPKEVSTTGVTLGDGQTIQNYFNTGSYKVAGEAAPVTGGSDSAYGYIEFTIKGGESKTITGLPAGTYYVQEVDGTDTNANWTYDTTQYEANLSSGSASVTITNTYKLTSLTITKNASGNTLNVKDSFVFKVYEGKDTTVAPYVTIVLQTGEYAVVPDLVVGTTYTVVEDTGWSWRFSCSDKDIEKSLTYDENPGTSSSSNLYPFENTVVSPLFYLDNESKLENIWSTSGITQNYD